MVKNGIGESIFSALWHTKHCFLGIIKGTVFFFLPFYDRSCR